MYLSHTNFDDELLVKLVNYLVSAITDTKVVVTFNTDVAADSAASSFTVSEKEVKSTVVSGKTVTLTVNSAFADGKEYTVTFKDIFNKQGTDKLDTASKTFEYKVASPSQVVLEITSFEEGLGQNIKENVIVKDTNGQVISEEDYNVTSINHVDTTGDCSKWYRKRTFPNHFQKLRDYLV